MDYEIADPITSSHDAPSANDMHVLLADFVNRPIKEIKALLPELSVTPSLWIWMIIHENDIDPIIAPAESFFTVSTISADETYSNKFKYPKIIKRLVAQNSQSSKPKLILITIKEQEQRVLIKSRFIRSASRQLHDRFIDLRLSEQPYTSFELEQLQRSCSILVGESNQSGTPLLQMIRAHSTNQNSLNALLRLIISFRSAAQSKRPYQILEDEGNYFEAIFEELSDYTQSDMRVYKETHVARIANSVATNLNASSARDLLFQIKSHPQVKSEFIKQLSLAPSLLDDDMPLLRQTLQQASAQLQLWAKGNAGELRIWIPNFRNYSLVKKIALHIKSVIASIDVNILLKIFASDNDIGRIQRAKITQAADKPIIGCNIILAHHDLLCQAPFSNVHILFLFKFMSQLGLSYANRLYSIYHFAMISGGLLISDESLTEEGSRYFTKPSALASHYINHKKSRRIQYPKLSAIQRRPVKMALPPQSINKLTSSLNRHYQTALLNKILTSHDEALLVVDDSLKVSHFYGVTDHFTNPYTSGQFYFSIERLLGDDYAKKIRECIFQLEEKDTQKISLNSTITNGTRSYLIELSILPSLNIDNIATTSTTDGSNLLYTIRIRLADTITEPQLAYNRLLNDRIRRLEARVDAVHQKYAAHVQWLDITKKQLVQAREKALLSTEEHTQLRQQFSDVANELTKLNKSHEFLLGSLLDDRSLKEDLLIASGTGVIICDFNYDNYQGLGALDPIAPSQQTSVNLKSILTQSLPSLIEVSQLSATDGKCRYKTIFIYGELIRFSITPITGITQQLSRAQCSPSSSHPYRVAIIFRVISTDKQYQ